jgi:site-specific DNA recombinase
MTEGSIRVALYARYSTDKQRPTSISDQFRLCREFAAKKGWCVVEEFSDAGISGDTLIRRPGLRSLLTAAQTQQFDVVLAELQSRFARDEETIAHVAKRLRHADVEMWSVQSGKLTRLHVMVQGLIDAQQLEQVADQTRRSLVGNIDQGKSAGGLCYGYRVVPSLRKDGRGGRAIDEGQAAIVRRIFRAFGSGESAEAIAKALNREGVPGPRRAWSPSTIYGNWKRGTGIINNELYIGRLIWNRQRFAKHPDTGKRQPRLNDPSAWKTADVPELRIISDELWHAAKAQQTHGIAKVKAGGIASARRPTHLFSGLIKCALCKGGFTTASRDDLRCFNYSKRDACTNDRRIKRQEVEARVLRAMVEKLFDDGSYQEFRRGFFEQMQELRREHLAQQRGAQRELQEVECKIRKIVAAVLDGVPGSQLKEEANALQARKDELLVLCADPTLPTLHPAASELFRSKAATLAAALQHRDGYAAARQALRGFLDRIVIPPGDGQLQVVGNLGAMFAAADVAAGRKPELSGVVATVGCGGGI